MTSTITAPHAVPDALVFGDPQLHTDGDLLALAFAPDGSLWSIEDPGVVRHWNSSGQELSWHSPSDLEDLWCISNDARVLASASNDLSVWDASSGNLLSALPQAVWVTALAFAPDPAFLATGHDDGIVRYWDASTHQLVPSSASTSGRSAPWPSAATANASRPPARTRVSPCGISKAANRSARCWATPTASPH